MTIRRQTVRARVHHGTSSLDMSIPSEITKEYDIRAGDVFEVTTLNTNKELKIIYRRVYSQPKI